MHHSEGTFEGVGGVRLYYQRWTPEGESCGVVALVHGVGEHSGRYGNIVTPLVDAGWTVCAYDHRGHGRSEGRRVHIENWSEYHDDLATHLAMSAEQVPGRPVVVYGHSMGALVVLEYLVGRPVGLSAAVVSGSPIQPVGVGSPMLIAVARLMTGVLPAFPADLGIDASSLTRDPAALAAYHADPLVTGKATVRWGTETLKAVERVKSGMDQIDLPLHVIHGEDDPLNHVDGARDLFAAVPRADKTLHTYPGVLHEPHNDVGHEQLAADVVKVIAPLVPGWSAEPIDESASAR